MRSLRRLATHATALAVFVAIPFASTFADPSHQWSIRFGSTSFDRINAVTVDAAGNVFITGRFEGSVSFGGAPLSSIAGPGFSMFVAKFSPSGTHLWSNAFVGEGLGIAADASGNIFVTGAFEGTTNFGGGSLTSAKATPGPTASDVFLVKFDTNGAHQWSQRFGGPSVPDAGNGIAVDATGAVIITGAFVNAVDFGGGAISGGGQSDVFVAKYDSNGVHQWSRAFGGTRFDLGKRVSVDDGNNVLITGTFLGTTDFGGGPIVNSFGDAVFLAKYDATGNHMWSRAATGYVSSTRADVAGLVASDSRSPIIVGYFSGYYNFGGADLGFSGGSDDVFIARYDQDGAHLWSHWFGFGGTDRAAALAVTSTGLFITGMFDGSIDFGGGILTGVGSQDIFVAKFNLAGSHVWSKLFGGTQSDVSRSIALSPLGNVVVGGNFSGTTDLGGGGLVSAGSEDAFVASYLDEAPVPVLFAKFDASVARDGVQVRWELTADEELADYTVYRRDRDAASWKPLVTLPLTTASGSFLDRSTVRGNTYEYSMLVRTGDGDQFSSPTMSVELPGLELTLGRNHPNPFNPQTVIPYNLPANGRVRVMIYDASGRLVRLLVDEQQQAGPREVTWNGQDQAGHSVSSGVYFCVLQSAKERRTQKMVLLK